MTEAELKSGSELTKHTPYLTLSCELWGVYYEDCGENWPRFNGPQCSYQSVGLVNHDDVIKWKQFPRYWPFVRRIHRSRWIPRTKASDAERWCVL